MTGRTRWCAVIAACIAFAGVPDAAGSPLPRQDGPASRNDVVVFVHGYTAGPGVWNRAIDYFASRGFDRSRMVAFDYSAYDKDRISTIGDRLAAFITGRLTGNQRFHVVAHSMGGLVARSAIDTLGNTRRGALVTLSTPNHGVGIATWCSLLPPACTHSEQDMAPSSNFLDHLNTRTEDAAEYSTHDTLTYAIDGDTTVKSGVALTLARNLRVAADAPEIPSPPVRRTVVANSHNAIVTKQEVIDDAIETIDKAPDFTGHAVLTGKSPKLHGGDCTWNHWNGTIRWTVPADTPTTLQVQVEGTKNGRTYARAAYAADGVAEKLYSGGITYKIRFKDSAEHGHYSDWSTFAFDGGVPRCGSTWDQGNLSSWPR